MNDEQKELIKKLEWFSHRERIQDVFCEAVEFNALKVALLCDINNCEQRKQRQQIIIKQYDKNNLSKFYEVCACIDRILIGMIDNFKDYLGEIYMTIGAANKQNQQYFTPMSIGYLMAAINLSDIDFTKPVSTIGEPCCGSGGILIAALKYLTEKKINYTDKVLIVANDIDKNCVNMCYLQLAFSGATAIVRQQNTITQQVIGETFITPAFALQCGRFTKHLKEL